MKEILFDEIPSLDLADFTSGSAEKKAAFVRKLGEAYNNIGFVAIKNHGLAMNCRTSCTPVSRNFLHCPMR